MSVINVDVNIAYGNFFRLLLTYYNECFHVQRVYLKDKEDNPWMTTSLQNDCKKKSIFLKCYSSKKLIALNTLHRVVPTWY